MADPNEDELLSQVTPGVLYHKATMDLTKELFPQHDVPWKEMSLLKASEKGRLDIVNAYIEGGADVNVKDEVRRRPLRVAVLPAAICRMHLQSLPRDSSLFSLSLPLMPVLDAGCQDTTPLRCLFCFGGLRGCREGVDCRWSRCQRRGRGAYYVASS